MEFADASVRGGTSCALSPLDFSEGFYMYGISSEDEIAI